MDNTSSVHPERRAASFDRLRMSGHKSPSDYAELVEAQAEGERPIAPGRADTGKRCLVTGGAGFVGSHLCDRLLADGHSVTVIDSLITGHKKNLAPHARLNFVEADINDAHIAEYFSGIDWVFHMAALADIVPSMERPAEYHRANVDGTFAVLEAARAHRVSRLVYTASSSCYGIPDTFPTPETAEVRAMYPYALTKWIGEQTALHFCKVYQLPVVSLRLFNVYGPRSRSSGTYGAVFGTFLAQKLAGRPLTVVGDGKQTRDFTYVTDVVDAFVRAAVSNVTGEIFNVGSGGSYAVNELVRLIGGEIVHIPKRPGEPDCTFADTARIRQQLKWQPRVKFPDGVRLMLESIELWRDAPVWTPDSIAQATESWFRYLGVPKREENHGVR